MEKCNNRIITLSGDPGSGKGSVSKKLNELYEAQGLKPHIVSVGDLFRKILVREYKKKFPRAKEPSLDEIYSNPDFAEKIKEIDANMDNEIAKLVEEFYLKNTTGEVLILDSRRAVFIIKKLAEKILGVSQICFHVRFETDAKTAGERIFKDKKRGSEDRYLSVEDAIEDTAKRRENEIQSCKEQYNKDLTDHSHFDLIIGTKLASVDDIAKTTKICEELKRDNKPFCKTWASPELFYPTQKFGQTDYQCVWMIENEEERRKSLHFPFATTKELQMLYPNQQIDHNTTQLDIWVRGAYDLEEFAHLIEEKGINPNQPITATSRGKSLYKFVEDGHHRVFGSIMARQTLVPYEIIKHIDSETISEYDRTNIYDHEIGASFRYEEYPEVEKEKNEDEQEQ